MDWDFRFLVLTCNNGSTVKFFLKSKNNAILHNTWALNLANVKFVCVAYTGADHLYNKGLLGSCLLAGRAESLPAHWVE